jgi:hypothetical protein
MFFELLQEILSSFVPTAEQIVQDKMFRNDCELQMLALKLCFYGKRRMLTLEYLLDPTVCQYLKDNMKQHDMYFLDTLIEDIPNGDYLLTRSWFCRHSSPYQLRVLMLKMMQKDHHITANAGDFCEHLDNLLALFKNAFPRIVGYDCDDNNDGYVDRNAYNTYMADNTDNDANDDANYDVGYYEMSEEERQEFLVACDELKEIYRKMDADANAHDDAHDDACCCNECYGDCYEMTEEEEREYQALYEERWETYREMYRGMMEW